MIRIILSLFFLSFIQGCSTIRVPEDFSSEKYPNQGVLVVSTTVPQFEELVGFELRYHIVKAEEADQDRDERGSLTNNYFYLKSYHMQDDSMFSDADGTIHAEALYPGKYKLMRWSMSTGAGLFIYPKELEPVFFEIFPGKITYLGSIHMNNSYGKNIFGIPLARGGIVTFSDEQQRDMGEFSKVRPNILIPIDKQIPKVPIWLPKGVTMSDFEKTPEPAEASEGLSQAQAE